MVKKERVTPENREKVILLWEAVADSRFARWEHETEFVSVSCTLAGTKYFRCMVIGQDVL